MDIAEISRDINNAAARMTGSPTQAGPQRITFEDRLNQLNRVTGEAFEAFYELRARLAPMRPDNPEAESTPPDHMPLISSSPAMRELELQTRRIGTLIGLLRELDNELEV